MSDASKRKNVVGVRFTDAETRDLDSRRGGLSRTDYLRWLVMRARKEGVNFGGGDDDAFSG